MPLPPLPLWLRKLRFRLGLVVLTTLVICTALQLLFGLAVNIAHVQFFETLYLEGFALSLPGIANLHLWQFLTYGLVHDLTSPFHLLFNGLALYWFAPPFERRYGSLATLRLLLMAVLLGGLFQTLWMLMDVKLLHGDPSFTVGISAAIMAFCAAFGWMQPTTRVLVMFVVPLEARWLAPLGLAIDFLLFASGSHIAFFAHLGGYLAAWFLVKGRGNPQFIWKQMTQRKRPLVVVN